MAKSFVSSQDVNWLKENCLLSEGSYMLSSGITVDSYFDAYRILTDSGKRYRFMQIMGKLFSQSGIGHLRIYAGTESGGAIIAAMLAARWSKDFFMVRKAPRTHGTLQQVEGPSHIVRSGKPTVVLIDDVVSTGETQLASIRKLEDVGYLVSACVAVAYRGAGAYERLKDKGILLYAAVYDEEVTI